MLALEIIGGYFLTGFISASLLYKFEQTFSTRYPKFLDGNVLFILTGILCWPFAILAVLVTQMICRTIDYLNETNESVVTSWLRYLRGEPKPKKKGIEA